MKPEKELRDCGLLRCCHNQAVIQPAGTRWFQVEKEPGLKEESRRKGGQIDWKLLACPKTRQVAALSDARRMAMCHRKTTVYTTAAVWVAR